jgi:predicted Zn-dependent protease
VGRLMRYCLSLATMWLAAAAPHDASALTLIRDAEIEHTLRAYGDPIFEIAGVTPSAVHIFIIQDDTINAYVAGGSNIFLHTGLILACDTPGMLIGAMAHETGHIVGGHLAQGAEKLRNAQLGVVLSYVLGAAAAVGGHSPDAAMAIIGGGQQALQRNMLSFSRSNENAADQSALSSLSKLHISASGMLKLFEKLLRNENMHMGAVDPYVLTHPLSSERIANVRSHLMQSDLPETAIPKEFIPMHERMLAKLHGFLEDPKQTFRRYPESDTSVPARMARAIALHKQSDTARALAEMDALIRLNPKDPFFHELKGQILFESGRIRESRDAYAQAVTLLPDAALLQTSLGEVLIADGSPEALKSALVHLEKSSILDNDNADTWRLLGTAYGKTGNEGMSHLALAEEAVLHDDPELALRQAQAALQTIPTGTPAHLRAEDLRQIAQELKQRKKDESGPGLSGKPLDKAEPDAMLTKMQSMQ